MELNLADLFELVADTVGQRTAMVAGTRRLTYSELDHRANGLAHYLEAAGIGPAELARRILPIGIVALGDAMARPLADELAATATSTATALRRHLSATRAGTTSRP